jgi:hypothetical protein
VKHQPVDINQPPAPRAFDFGNRLLKLGMIVLVD